MKTQARQSRRDNAEPHAIVETLIAGGAALATAGGVLWDMGTNKPVAVKPEDPLLFCVLGAELRNGRPELIIRIKNLGLHGAYIDGVAAVEPRECKLEVNRHYEPNRPFDLYWAFGKSAETDEDALPIFVPSQESILTRIVILDFPKARLKKSPSGMLRFSYIVAGVARRPKHGKAVEYSLLVNRS